MTRKKLFVAVLAVCTLLSCTKEVVKEVYIEGGGTETGTTVVTFALDANMVQTRATGDHGSLNPTIDENKIYNYAVFIFKSNGMLEATLKAKSPTLGSPLAPNSNGLLTFDPLQNPDLKWNADGSGIIISAGQKTFFAIVNAPYEFVDDQDSFINNETLTLTDIKNITLNLGGELNKIVGQYGVNSDGTLESLYFQNPVQSTGANRGFMMTNIVTTAASSTAGTVAQRDGFYTQTLEEKDEDDPATPITVTVGRAMAKVSLASDLTPVDQITTQKDLQQAFGALKVEGYKIINNPNKMNVVIDMTGNVLQTPYFREQTVNTADYFISNNSSQGTNYIPVSKSPDNTFAYCIENANQTPKYGNTTIATIKGYFKPLSGALGDATILDPTDLTDTDASLNPNGDFWRIWIPPPTQMVVGNP